MTTVILFVIGAIVGSFLNAVAMRWGRKGFGKYSCCPHCHKTLHWYELIPIISFLIQRAKCRNCGASIPLQYLAVEILTGLVFVTIPYLMLPVFCIYIVIFIYDLHHKIIPDLLVYFAIVLSILMSLYADYGVLDWLAGPIIFVLFGFIWLFSRGRAMGFGDAKLGLSVGILLGAAQGFSAIILAFWIGAAVFLTYIFLRKTVFIKDSKKFTMKSEVPFAPFIILGAWASLVFHLDIFHVLLF